MKIGVLVNNFGGFPDTNRGARACVDLAIQAERLGFASVWVTDHVVLPTNIRAHYPHGDTGFPYTWEQDIYEPIVMMAAIAQATERVQIGASVLVIPYRHPLLAAKMLATADQLSNGRIVLGAGVGWLRDEFEALGLPPELFERRGAVTMDYLRAMQRAWSAEQPARHAGRYTRFEELGTRPLPARSSGIPIWIGGAGDRALRRSVELGDGYLAISASAEQLRAETGRLRTLTAAAGRPQGAVAVALIDGIVLGGEPASQAGVSFHGSAEQVLEALARYADAGLEHLVAGISISGQRDFSATVAALEQVAAEILPAAATL